MPAKTAAASVRSTYNSDSSATRVDTALLVSTLFLQRFTLPVGTKVLSLSLVVFGIILLNQFLRGKLVIQYDRFLWFLAFAFASTCALLLNFKSTMLTSYFQTSILFFLFTLNRPSTPDQYKKTLQVFQFLVMLLSCIAILQFWAQFVLDNNKLLRFYGIVPDILLGEDGFSRGFNTGAGLGGGLAKSNGIFLGEPSTLSQVTALGILIEVLEFRRPRYLIIMTLGFLVAYSGTGLMLLLLFLPLAGLREDRAMPHALLVVIFALGLVATGIIELSHFTSRVGEFEAPGSSGFGRFVVPFYLAAAQFDMEALQGLLLGNGPSTTGIAVKTPYGWASSDLVWTKFLREYGLIGSFLFWWFYASCFRRSRCRGLVIAAISFSFLFLNATIIHAIPLCTLNGPERRGRVDETNRYRSSLAARAETV
jgi:hypothetical protein